MAKTPRDQDTTPLERTLREGFEAVEAQPVPGSISDHVDRLVDGGTDDDANA